MKRLAFLVLGLVLLGVACVLPGAPRPRPTPITQDHVYADSLGAQVVATSVEDNDGQRWHARNGADLAYWADDVIGQLHAGPRDITLALGMNDAMGWTPHDRAVWAWVLAAAQRDDCISVVLPNARESFEGLERARFEITHMTDRWVDWNPPADVWADDGIHLAAWGPGAQYATDIRHAVVMSAAGLCDA